MDNKNTKTKKERKPLSKDAKKLIVVGVIFLVIFSIIFGLKTYTKSGLAKSMDLQKLASLSVKIMPKSLEINTSSGDIEFFMEKSDKFDDVFKNAYIEKTDQYDLSKINIYEALNFYYYDDQNKRVDLRNGEYNTAADHIILISHFGERLSNSLKLADSIYTGLLIALTLGFIIYLIYIWYKAWCIKENKREAELKKLNAPKKSNGEEK